MITADPPEYDQGIPFRWTFRLVDADDGWHLTLTSFGGGSLGYAVRFYRVRPNPGYREYPDQKYREYRELLRAKMLRPGIVRISDASLAKLSFEDGVAFNGLLSALPDHPPLKRYRGWPGPERS